MLGAPPPPLWGRVGVGGSSKGKCLRWRAIARPPPLTPPPKGEGNRPRVWRGHAKRGEHETRRGADGRLVGGAGGLAALRQVLRGRARAPGLAGPPQRRRPQRGGRAHRRKA